MAATPQHFGKPQMSEHVVTTDQSWRELTEAANRAYVAKDMAQAHDLYRAVLDQAERLFAQASTSTCAAAVPIPVIYNISCHNLAEFAQHTGNASVAEDYLLRAYDRLVASAESPLMPLSLRLDCMQHLKHALVLIVQHLHHRGATRDQIAPYLDRAKEAAFVILRVALHAETAQANCDHCPVVPS